jgi:hypothetical protein
MTTAQHSTPPAQQHSTPSEHINTASPAQQHNSTAHQST